MLISHNLKKSDWVRLFEIVDLEAQKSKKLLSPRRTINEYKAYVESKNYSDLLNLEVTKSTDLVKAMCIAYSWMPTMLDIHLNDARTAIILKRIKNLKDIDWGSDEELILISELSKAANNSLVGAIKTLHLINPNRFPLIDSRVLIAWKRFIDIAGYTIEIKNLGNSWNIGSHQEQLQKLILKYFYYRYFIFEWVSNLENGMSMRDIEFRLYLMGEKK